MSTKEKIIVLPLGGLITTLVVYAVVSLFTSDAAFSIVPGWHTTIYPSDIKWGILTLIILVVSLLVYGIFSVVVKLLTTLWTKLKS